MKKIKNHQRPRREYIFDIVDDKKALKIWRDSTFKSAISNYNTSSPTKPREPFGLNCFFNCSHIVRVDMLYRTCCAGRMELRT